MKTVSKKIEYIKNWIQNYLDESGAKGIVFGVSGGIDSAVISAIASKFFPNNHLALSMDIKNSEKDIRDARLVINHFNLKHKIIDLEKTYETMCKALETNPSTFGNIKSRLRMITLYSFAQENCYLVIGSSNFVEIMIGYFTKYGDSGSDIMPLANLLKSDIKEMALYLGVPKDIINKKPTAGLYDGQTDEDELGITYDEMDLYFKGKNKNISSKDKIKKMIKNSSHKRSMPKSPLKIGKVM